MAAAAAYSVIPTLFTLLLLLIAHPILSSDPPESSPSPSPSPSPSYVSPVPSPAFLVSSPAPPLPDYSPNSPPSPAPSPSDGDDDSNADDGQDSDSPTPAPSPAVVGDKDQSTAGNLESNYYDDDDNGSGMNGGKKAGVAIGVIAGVCVVGLGALVYKKRQDNIRRSQYGYAADIL